MNKILPVLLAGVLGAGSAAAQSSTSVQAGTSTQTQGSAQAGKSGTKVSGAGSSSTSTSTSASANAGGSSASLSSGTKIDATLAGSLDARKSKAGDRVEARTAQDVKQDGKVVLKKGTTLIGHVTQAQAHTSEQTQSQLGIAFDHAMMNGQAVPFNATIQALAASQSSAAAAVGSDDVMMSGGTMGAASGAAHGGGGLVGGVGSTAGGAVGTVVNTASSVGSISGNAAGTVNAATHSAGAVGGLTSAGRLSSNSSGVFGLQGLSINSATSNATQGSLIVSPVRTIHLDSGTQMLLSVTGQAQ
jgi:hypothetical protein